MRMSDTIDPVPAGVERGEVDSVPAEFSALAARMPPVIHLLLVDNVDPSGIPTKAVFAALNLDPARHLATDEAQVLSVPHCLDAVACATLRDAVDRRRNTRVDSVDGAADHQLPLTLMQLEQLIGTSAVDTLLALPARFSDEASGIGKPREIFVRRYTGGTRPWNPFHHDAAAVTINVALGDDAAFAGGRLLAVRRSRVEAIERGEGEATVHDSRLLHAVSRITGGVRYSLIMFLGHAEAHGGMSTAEAAAFAAYLRALPDDASRQLVAQQLRALEAPLEAALSARTREMDAKRSMASPAKAAIERARHAHATARGRRERAERAAQEAEEAEEAALTALNAAIEAAQAMREEHFGAQVAVQRLRMELLATQREGRSRLLREAEKIGCDKAPDTAPPPQPQPWLQPPFHHAQGTGIEFESLSIDDARERPVERPRSPHAGG